MPPRAALDLSLRLRPANDDAPVAALPAPGRARGPVRVIEPRRATIHAQLLESWRYRGLVGHYGRRFVGKRYARTWLGWVWLPLRPVLALAAKVFVFGGLLGVPSGHVPYLIFFIVAMGAWQLFTETTYWATRSLELNRRELRHLHVPRLVPLVAAVVPSFVEYLIYTGIGVCALLYYLVVDGTLYLRVGPQLLVAVLGLVLIMALGLGVGLWTSTFAVRARDIRFGLGYVMSFWFFLTPVIYPLDVIPAKYRLIASLNPVTAPVEMVRYGLLGIGDVTRQTFGLTVGVIVVLFVGGLWFFGKPERLSFDDL